MSPVFKSLHYSQVHDRVCDMIHPDCKCIFWNPAWGSIPLAVSAIATAGAVYNATALTFDKAKVIVRENASPMVVNDLYEATITVRV